MPEVILGRDMQTNQIIPISDVERRSGLYILGRMGRGKTSLMTKLIEQDMANGHGVFFLDPHGDAVEDLQQRIPSDRQNDVIVLDPSDKLYSFGLNPLACSDPDDMTKRSGTYAQAMAIFQKLFANIQTEELDILLNQYLRNSFFPLIANQGYTLLEIPLLLADKPFRERLLEHPSVRPEVVRFWHTKFDRLSPTDRDKETASTERRLDQFQDFDEIRHIVGQSRSTIDFVTIMQERKILFIKLKKTLPGDAWRIIGTLLISSLIHAVRQREQIPEAERHQFCIFVDEFQNFASSDDFAVLFTEARKYGIATTIAHQERYGQFADNKRIAGATDAAVIKLFFQPTPHDAAEQAVEFAARATPTERHREAELVFSPHPIEDIWEKGHPEKDMMFVRRKYFSIVDLLKRTPQEQYFLFDPSRILAHPEYEYNGLVNKYMQRDFFEDWEYYRSSADMLREAISLLNNYYYDLLQQKYSRAKPFTDKEMEIFRQIAHCLAGIFGIYPVMEPYIPDPMRYPLFKALERFEPRNTDISITNKDKPYGSSYSRQRYQVYGGNVRKYIYESDFPRTLFPYKPSVDPNSSTLKIIPWQPGHQLTQNEYMSRVRICCALLGTNKGLEEYELTLADIPTTIADCSLLQGIRQLANYIGMPQHESDKLIEWRIKPWMPQIEQLVANQIRLTADQAFKLAIGDKTHNELYGTTIDQWKKFIAVTTPVPLWHKGQFQYSNEVGDLYREKVLNRAWAQVSELGSLASWLFSLACSMLWQKPMQLPSGKYDETLKVERTQQDLNNDMVQELLELQPHTAYVKSAAWKGKIQSVVVDKAAAALLAASRIELVDVRGIARDNAVRDRILRKRGDIEAEIRERQERWRRPPDNEPPSPTTGGDSPPPSPPGGTGQAQEPPPTIYLADSPDERAPFEGQGTQAGKESRVIDFTAYRQKRRGEPTASFQTVTDPLISLTQSAPSLSEAPESLSGISLPSLPPMRASGRKQPENSALPEPRQDLSADRQDAVQSGTAMAYAFFCDRCGGKLAGNEKRLRLHCEQCGNMLSEEEFYRQLDKQRDEDFCEQFIAASRKEREEYWRGVRRAGAGRLLIPAPVERAHVPQWSAYMTGILGKYRGTPDKVYFSRLGLDISTNACGERLYERFFESAGDHGNPLIFINTILTTFDHWERITYCDITKVLARMYGEDAGLHANGMINTGQRTVLGKLEDMPTLDLFLESLNFYESGKEFLDRRERTYTTSFKKRSTRYVNVALSISNSLYAKQDKTYQVVYRWFHPAGTLLREQESEWTIISKYDDFVATQRFGRDLPGYWTPGTYRLVILVDGVIFAQRPFTIEV